MRLVDKPPSMIDPATKARLDKMKREYETMDYDALASAMCDDHSPDQRCFMARCLHEIGQSAAAAFLFERRERR